MNFVCKSFQYRKKIVWLSDNQCARKKTELPNESIPTTKNLGQRTSGVSIIIPGLIAGYLLTCREEAKDCPQIVVADIDTSPFLQKQTVKIKEVSNTYKYAYIEHVECLQWTIWICCNLNLLYSWSSEYILRLGEYN